MKKILTTLIFILSAILCKGQENYLNYFVDDNFLVSVYPSGYEIKYGRYDYRNGIYNETTFQGISGNWEIEIRTDKNGIVDLVSYDYIKYPSNRRLPSSVENEIIHIANNAIEGSGTKVETKELDVNPTGGSSLYYKGYFPSQSIVPILSISIRGSWDHNSFEEVFFGYLRIYFIRTP